MHNALSNAELYQAFPDVQEWLHVTFSEMTFPRYLNFVQYLDGQVAAAISRNDGEELRRIRGLMLAVARKDQEVAYFMDGLSVESRNLRLKAAQTLYELAKSFYPASKVSAVEAAWEASRDHGKQCGYPTSVAKILAPHALFLEEPALPVKIRNKVLSDTDDIVALLCEIAHEIPVRVDGAERISALEFNLRSRWAGPYSLVAENDEARLVGFLLAEGCRETYDSGPEYVHLAYIGIERSHRRVGVCRNLVSAAKAMGYPLFAEVQPENRSKIATILQRLGFWPSEKDHGSGFFWSPSQSTLSF